MTQKYIVYWFDSASCDDSCDGSRRIYRTFPDKESAEHYRQAVRPHSHIAPLTDSDNDEKLNQEPFPI